MYTPNDMHPQQPQMRIAELRFIETGTYNPQYNRTYEVQANNAAQNMLSEATLGGTRVNPTVLAGIAGNIIRPTANAGNENQVMMVNGWASKRLRFIAQIHYPTMGGGMVIQFVSGYTNHMGVGGVGTARPQIDPNMQLFFNNSILMQEMVEQTPLGPRAHRRITSAAQILSAASWAHAGGGQFGPSVNPTRFIRPEDLLTKQAGVNEYGAGQQMMDMRQTFGKTRPMVKSRYANGSASNYLSRAINGQLQALAAADYDSNTSTIMGVASGLVKEDSIAQDNFMSWLMQRGLLSPGGAVTWGELCSVDPQADAVAEFYVGGDAALQSLEPQHQTGQTAEWNMAVTEAPFASILAQALPAAMLDCMITRCGFRATNRIVASQLNMGANPHTVAFTSVYGLTDVGMQEAAMRLMTLLQNQLLPDVSMNGQIDYEITCNMDVFGESSINVSCYGRPGYRFVVPSFSDSLMVPVITTKVGALDSISSDLTFMVDTLHRSGLDGPHQQAVSPINSPYGF